MRSILISALLTFGTLSVPCWADVALHLAYQHERPASVPANFSNDRSFRYVSRKPYILSSELLDAKVVKSKYGYVVKLTLAPTAVKKFNAVAEANTRAQAHQDFEAHTGLGVFVDGQPSEVIQGVFQPLTDNALWWSVYPQELTADALREARARVAAIKSRK